VSIADDEIEIGGRRYVSAGRVASLFGISVRTLSRLGGHRQRSSKDQGWPAGAFRPREAIRVADKPRK
jgi:hypothetical protein